MTTAPKMPLAPARSAILLDAFQAMIRRPAPPTGAEMQALARLVEIAQGGTDQGRCVADFLLAWWNAGECGAFDLTTLWSVDHAIAQDMKIVFGMIADHYHYPDALSPTLHDDFMQIIKQWRPENL